MLSGPPCCLALRGSHTIQSDQRIQPALRPGCGRLHRVPLGRSPSLHHVRRCLVHTLVRRFLRHYAIVRLPTGVHAGSTVVDLFRPTRRTTSGYPWDLPFLVRRVSTHAQGLRLRGVGGWLALAPSAMLPSPSPYGVGTPVKVISELNGWPACAPVNASPASSRPPTHDSGSG